MSSLAERFPDAAKFLTRSDAAHVAKGMLGDHLPLLPNARGEMPAHWPRTCGSHFASGAERVEGLARLMLGAAFAGDDCRVPGLHEQIQGAISVGVDPQSTGYWGELGHFDQKIVEAANIAIAIVEGRHHFFDGLDFKTQTRLLDWLSDVQDVDMSPNNWRFFRVTIQNALKQFGRFPNSTLLQSDIEYLHSLYLGDGWYSDGPAGACDYYNPFAFHFYGLIYARWCDDEHARIFLERARRFAERYCYWFGKDGAPIAYGRSLCYRFAGAAFWGALAWFEIDTNQAGDQWRRTLRWWANQPIFNEIGQLSIGYAYPNLLASEFYNSPMSPLWAMKAFVPLVLNEQHAFWSEAKNVPASADAITSSAANHILYRYRGDAFLLPGGRRPPEMRQFADKYMKFAYSSCHGLCVESTQWIDAGFLGDNVLAVADSRNGWHQREKVNKAEIVDRCLITHWSPLPGCQIITRQHWDGEREHRTHSIVCEQPIRFLASGYAVDHWTPVCVPLPRVDGNLAVASSRELTSSISTQTSGVSVGVAPCVPNSNLLFPRASVPYISGDLSSGRHELETWVAAGRVHYLA